MLKKKNKFYRWLAVALTVALLAGQSHVFVLAEEEDKPLTEISDETATDAADNDNTGDNDSATDQDDENNGGADDKDAEGGKHSEDDENTEDHQGDTDQPEQTVSGNGDGLDADIVAQVAFETNGYMIGEDFEGSDGIKYRVTADGEVGVAGHRDGTTISGDLKIPETIDSGSGIYRVTNIINSAFENCKSLNSVEIPESITTIETSAFWGCSSLDNIVIPDSVTSMGNGVFYGCSGLKNIKLSGSLKSLSQSLFAFCTGLSGIDIPNGVERIEGTAFASTGLKRIKIPKSVISLKESAFSRCSNLESVEISNGLAEIDRQAFLKCYVLSTLYIVVGQNESVLPPAVVGAAFDEIPYDRSIVFLAEDGTVLTGDALEAAKSAYLGDSRDGNDKDDLWWGWRVKEPAVIPATAYIIDASAGEGGSISPSGTVSVNEGESRQFTITPDDGYRIKAVAVDGADKTEELVDSVTKAQTGVSKDYIFQNVRENHTIAASFEREASSGDTPGGDDNTGDDDDQGDDKPDGGTKPDGGGSDGDNSNDETSDENSRGNTQIAGVLKVAAPQTAAGSNEPKTGDASHAEIYATVAMIAGLTYLLLCFMEEGRGMTEREKEVFVAAFIRWAKKGGAFRRGCAIVAIFCILVYYHSIGKRVSGKKKEAAYEAASVLF